MFLLFRFIVAVFCYPCYCSFVSIFLILDTTHFSPKYYCSNQCQLPRNHWNVYGEVHIGFLLFSYTTQYSFFFVAYFFHSSVYFDKFSFSFLFPSEFLYITDKYKQYFCQFFIGKTPIDNLLRVKFLHSFFSSHGERREFVSEVIFHFFFLFIIMHI